MNTLFLRYAVEIEKTGSISKAAENLYTTQPRLSKSIKDLEQSIGIKIFKRTSRGVVPTDDGKEFLLLAKNVLAKVNEIKHISDKNTSITISTVYDDCIISLLQKALSQSRELAIFLKEVTFSKNDKTIEDVKQGECDIGIVRIRSCDMSYFIRLLENDDIKYSLLRSFEAGVYLSKNSVISESKVENESLKLMTETANSSLPFGTLHSLSLLVSGDPVRFLCPNSYVYAAPYFERDDCVFASLKESESFSDLLICKNTSRVKKILPVILDLFNDF